MAKYITEIEVSLNDADERHLQGRYFNKINVDLNTGASGNFIYLWYKKGEPRPITRIQVSYSDGMGSGLTNVGYKKIEKDLNAGAGGDSIYLWYYSGSTEYDTPIVELKVTVNAADEAPLYKLGWERVGCDLNRKASGNFIYLWVKREEPTYICNVTATNSSGPDADLFKEGYIRVDEDLNQNASGAWVFIWYRQTTSTQRALTSLEISTNGNEYQIWQQQGYQSVNVNLNEGTGGNDVFLWYKKDTTRNPMQALSVLFDKSSMDPYMRNGVQVIKRNLNSGNKGALSYLAFYQ